MGNAKESAVAPRESAGAPCACWRFVAQGDPYRLLFPLGALLGVAGVAAWPLHVAGIVPLYPNLLHARIMVEGFLASFVVGFVGTALPRLLGAPKMTATETIAFASGLFAATLLQFAGQAVWGDATFVVTLAGFAAWLLSRAARRADLPPPGFVLVGFGVLSGLAGALLQIADATCRPGLVPVWLWATGRLLLTQGFMLLPVMGVGPFLLPRFFGLPSRHDLPESPTPSPEWRSKARGALAAGLAILASFAISGLGCERSGSALRATVVLAYFVFEMPFNFSAKGSLVWGVRIALASVPLGFACAALYPVFGIASLHIVFITGFGLLAFVVSCRVVFGHGGQSDKFGKRLWSVRALIGFLVLAMLTRVSADFMPATKLHHYAYAAVSWITAAFIWCLIVRRGLCRGD